MNDLLYACLEGRLHDVGCAQRARAAVRLATDSVINRAVKYHVAALHIHAQRFQIEHVALHHIHRQTSQTRCP
jgi:hypothetical protein